MAYKKASKIDPKNVYKNLGLLDTFQFWIYKVKEEVLQTTSNNNILHYLKIINQAEFDATRKVGYNFSHKEKVCKLIFHLLSPFE